MSVLHPATFWSLYTSLGIQKTSPKNQAVLSPKVSQTDNKLISFVWNLLKTGHLMMAGGGGVFGEGLIPHCTLGTGLILISKAATKRLSLKKSS